MPRDDTRAEQEARRIAALLPRRDNRKIQVRYDRQAEAWTVRVKVTGGLGRSRRFELAISAAGAVYGLFRDGQWIGGMGNDLRSGQSLPLDVATRFERQINAHLP